MSTPGSGFACAEGSSRSLAADRPDIGGGCRKAPCGPQGGPALREPAEGMAIVEGFSRRRFCLAARWARWAGSSDAACAIPRGFNGRCCLRLASKTTSLRIFPALATSRFKTVPTPARIFREQLLQELKKHLVQGQHENAQTAFFKACFAGHSPSRRRDRTMPGISELATAVGNAAGGRRPRPQSFHPRGQCRILQRMRA